MDDNTAFWAHNEAIFRLTELCAGLQKDIHTLQCQVMELELQVKSNAQDVGNLYEGVDSLVAMHDTLSAVFTIEAPAAAVCPECNGEGSDFFYICERCNGTGKWVDSFGPYRLHSDCEACQGTGKVQS